MRYLFIFAFASCMMLDAIVPASCQSEEYRKHRFDNWTTGEEDSTIVVVDSVSADTTVTP